MRRAQAESYAATGKPLRLPLYRHVIDAALASPPGQGKGDAATNGGVARELARLLNTTTQVPAPDGGAIGVPPLDTEKFAELVNRLDRAPGLVAKVVVDMPRLRGVRPAAGEDAKMRERLSALVRYADIIADMTDAPRPTLTAADWLRSDKGTYVLLLYLRRQTSFPRVGLAPDGLDRLPHRFGRHDGDGAVVCFAGHEGLLRSGSVPAGRRTGRRSPAR